MTTGQVAAFLLFALVAAVTPGPSNVVLAATGAQVGVVRGLPCLLGQTTGMGLMLFLVLSGAGSLVLGHPPVLGSLHWTGAAVLLWLSWRVARGPDHLIGPGEGKPIGYIAAVLFQWVNPKAWLVVASAAGTFLTAAAGNPITRAAVLGGLFVLAALPACFIWLAFGAAVQRLLGTPRRMRIFSIGMGSLLALSVILILR